VDSKQPLNPTLPDGVDDKEYKRIRSLMRVSVLSVWRAMHEVIAGIDPLDVVDEAWTSMAQKNFESEGPFLPFALAVAKNKALDSLRRAEVKRRVRSIDAPLHSDDTEGEALSLEDELAESPGAEVDYFRGLDQLAAMHKLALAEEAIYREGVLTDLERRVFIAVRVNGKSRAAIGRELDPPLTGQRVGQIVATAFIKVQAYLAGHEQSALEEERRS
jgi:DNA-directed RNA polymerase specialized sigma24 family protein